MPYNTRNIHYSYGIQNYSYNNLHGSIIMEQYIIIFISFCSENDFDLLFTTNHTR